MAAVWIAKVGTWSPTIQGAESAYWGFGDTRKVVAESQADEGENSGKIIRQGSRFLTWHSL